MTLEERREGVVSFVDENQTKLQWRTVGTHAPTLNFFLCSQTWIKSWKFYLLITAIVE